MPNFSQYKSGYSRFAKLVCVSASLSLVLAPLATAQIAGENHRRISPTPSASDRLFDLEETGGTQQDAASPANRRMPLRFDDRVNLQRAQNNRDKNNGHDRDEDSHDREQWEEQAEEDADQPLYEDFAEYIHDTTGKNVTDALPLKRSNIKSPKLAESYALGSGDRVEIQVWGSVSAQYNVTLDETGRIFVPDVGSIPLAGVKANELTKVVRGYFNRIYKGFELRAAVDTARSTNVLVSGQAQRVGIQSIPATHTLLSATQTFARPSAGGSRRFVEFQRKNGPLQRFDLYCFFRSQCPALPEALEDGDTIRVPTRGKLVAVSGAVARPGIYELAADESMADLLDYAGGLSVVADPERVELHSFSATKEKDRTLRTATLADLCVTASPSDAAAKRHCAPLADGDYLDVQPKLALVRNAVTLVAPGVDPIKREFKPGMRLLDVLQPPLEKFIPPSTLQSLNAGSFTALTELDNKLKGLDLNAVMVYRLDRAERRFHPLMANYKEAVITPAGASNIELAEGDVIVIDNSSEWRTPRQKLSMSVRVFGEVNHPGRYNFVGIKKLGDVLTMAGGLTPDAAMWSAVVLRQGDVRNAVGRMVLDRALQSITDYQARQEQVNSDGKTSPAPKLPRAVSDREQNGFSRQAEKDALDLMRGRSVVYLTTKEGTSQELMLDPNDIIIIPARQDTYSCQGAFFRVGDVFIANNAISVNEAANRCGILDEMKPNLYHFIARENRVCKAGGWYNACPDVQSGDLLVSIPEAVRRQGTTMEWLDLTLKTLTAIATLKVLAQ